RQAGRLVQQVEEAVEANGRAPERGTVESPHSHILHRATWLKAPEPSGARLRRARERHPALRGSAAIRKIRKRTRAFKRAAQKFLPTAGGAYPHLKNR